MSDHSPKRSFLLSIGCFILAAGGAFAAAPAARFDSHMVWDTAIHRAVLFGGSTTIDSGTKVPYELGDTWEWTGIRWLPVYPVHSPSARAAESMVFDSLRNRVVIFGGRLTKTNLDDTWTFDGTDWTQIQTATAPSVRELAGTAYDSTRDRIVLFGGTLQTYSFSGLTVTETSLRDTWEFDGTSWHQLLTDGPAVVKPILEYDPVHKQTIMLGTDVNGVTLMYVYDAAGVKWNQLKPATLPACATEGAMTFDGADNAILYTGGVCSGSALTEDSYEWDGTTWNHLTLGSFAGRYYGLALTYDPDHQVAVMFGGAPVSGALLGSTFTYAGLLWLSIGDVDYPAPRSLAVFAADPVNDITYLFGGVNDATSFFDFWAYQNGQFRPITDSNQPTDCTSPIAAFDTDRQKFVMFCEGSATWEYDGTTWTEYDTSKTAPPSHKFASLVYDQTLKKTVFFGGFDGVASYLNQTWTYDGTVWVQVTKNPPPSRSNAAMWYDPILKKTVLYGGIGRLTVNDAVSRFSDMWSFDGTGWTQITLPLQPIPPAPPAPATTPGMRYGAEVAVDPNTGHTFVFGGIRIDFSLAFPLGFSVYANDMWEWDGTTWKQVVSAVSPPPHENGGFTYDPLRKEFVLFGGYSGFYLSDLWSFSNGRWTQDFEVLNRRRASH